MKSEEYYGEFIPNLYRTNLELSIKLEINLL